MNRFKGYLPILAILVVAAVLRIAYLSELRVQPAFAHPEVDAAYHDAWARALATGNWEAGGRHDISSIPETPYFRPPGYPYALSVLYRCFGLSYLVPRVGQMMLGVLNVLLAFVLAGRLFARSVALIFAFLMAVYWVFIYFEGELLEPALLVFLALLLIFLLIRWASKPTLPLVLVSGVVLGLFALVRPNVLLFAPVVAAWVFSVARGPTGPRGAGFRVVLLTLGALLVVLPATLRNYRVSGDRVLISSNAGINLYIGNNEHADGLFVGKIMELGSFGTSDIYTDIVEALELQRGEPIRYSSVSRMFAGEALKFARENPGRCLYLAGRKALLFWGPVETGHNRSIHYDRHFSAILRKIPINFALALSLAIMGYIQLIAHMKKPSVAVSTLVTLEARAFKPAMALVTLFVLVYFCSFLPFFITGQYRVPVIPFLLLFGAYGLAGLYQMARSRDFKRAGLWGLGTCGLCLLLSINYAGYQPNLAKWYFDTAVAWEQSGRVEEAVAYYRKAMNADPGYAPPYFNLGNIYEKQGRRDIAVRMYRDALQRGINRPEKVYNNMGNSLVRQRRLPEAIEAYREALRINPHFTDAHKNLGGLFMGMGRPEEAVVHLKTALRLDPDSPLMEWRLGDALDQLGEKEEALEHYRKALQLNPGLAAVRKKLESAEP